MSYLSMRMREEGFWGRPKASEVPPLTITFTFDTSGFDEAVERLAARAGRLAAAVDAAHAEEDQ